jgi:hypothetical protein
VAELVADEVEITLPAPVRSVISRIILCRAMPRSITRFSLPRYMCQYMSVHQPERERLVADQRLVVAFGIADVLFAVAAIDEFVLYRLLHRPILVAECLSSLIQ